MDEAWWTKKLRALAAEPITPPDGTQIKRGASVRRIRALGASMGDLSPEKPDVSPQKVPLIDAIESAVNFTVSPLVKGTSAVLNVAARGSDETVSFLTTGKTLSQREDAAAIKVQAVMRGSSARKKSATSKRESTGEVCWRTDGGLGMVGWDGR
mgnify:CR=1 FL=1